MKGNLALETQPERGLKSIGQFDLRRGSHWNLLHAPGWFGRARIEKTFHQLCLNSLPQKWKLMAGAGGKNERRVIGQRNDDRVKASLVMMDTDLMMSEPLAPSVFERPSGADAERKGAL